MKEVLNKLKNITKQSDLYEDEIIGIKLSNIKDEEVLFLKRFDSNTWIIDKDTKKLETSDIVKIELVPRMD